MNANEIVKALRHLAKNSRSKHDFLIAAADLIEELQAKLVASQRREQAAVRDLCNCCKTYADMDGCKTDCVNCDKWRGPQEAGKEN